MEAAPGAVSADTSADSGSDSSDGADNDTDSSSGQGRPSAAVAIPAEETLFEISGDVTVGRAVPDGDGPDIALDVEEDAIVEQTHSMLTFDGDDSEWRVTDTSSTGTYVEVDDGEWLLLLSSEGAELHREHGFDPGAAADRDLSETTALEDGMAFTLEDPREDGALVCQFFASVDRARTLMKRGEIAEETQFSRFLM
jgi:hypothetical protein